MPELELISSSICPYAQRTRMALSEKGIAFDLNVIDEYLEEVFPERPLLPKDPAQRAQARIWIDFANVRFVPQIYKLMLAQECDKQAAHAEKLTEALLSMERDGLARSSGPYWLGDALSLVDLTFLPHSQRLSVVEHYRDFRIPDECRLFRAWLERMQQRPCVQAVSPTRERVIQGWSKYAYNTSTGTTAADMREL